MLCQNMPICGHYQIWAFPDMSLILICLAQASSCSTGVARTTGPDLTERLVYMRSGDIILMTSL